jgi:hypothetical protein
MDKISILVPSRESPGSLEDFITSVRDTCVDLERIEFIVRLDSCDPFLDDYKKVLDLCGVYNKIVIKDRIFYSGDLWEDCYSLSSGDIFFIAHDDVRVRTYGWDLKIRSVFNNVVDKISLVYCDDGYYEDKKCYLPFIHSRWVNTLGYVVPNGLRDVGYLYSDWLLDIARRCKRVIYLENYYIEHLLTCTGKYNPYKKPLTISEKYISSCNSLYNDLESLRADDANRLMKICV